MPCLLENQYNALYSSLIMIFKYLIKRLYIFFFVIIFTFSLDRISKQYVIYLNNNNLNGELFSSSYLNISLVWNEGIAFGLLAFEESKIYNFLSVFIALIVIIIFYMALNSNGIKKYALLMIIGGALGNLYDRLFFSAVPDFIDFHIGNFHWFIFNVSDIFITLGVIGMIVLELFNNKNEKT